MVYTYMLGTKLTSFRYYKVIFVKTDVIVSYANIFKLSILLSEKYGKNFQAKAKL